MIKNYKEAIERVDILASIGKAGNEGIYLKFKLIDLNDFFKSNYKKKPLELYVLLTTSLFYDYIFREDTKTNSKFKSKKYETNKLEYKFVRNLFIHNEQVLDICNFSWVETQDVIQLELSSELDTIFDINLSSLNSNIIEVDVDKVRIKKEMFITQTISVLESFLHDFICNTDRFITDSEIEIKKNLKNKFEFLKKVYAMEKLEKSYIDFVKSKLFFDDIQDYYNALYLCFIVLKLVECNIIKKEEYSQYIADCIDEDKYCELNEYIGNAYYCLVSSRGEPLENEGLIDVIRTLDYHYLDSDQKLKFSNFINTYRVDYRDSNLERSDLYKNYYVNTLVSKLHANY